MVKNALQAQLLKAGLVDNKKAKKLSKQAVHEQRTGQSSEAEIKAKIAQDKQQKQAKDQAIELEKKAILQEKELKATIIQMITQHKIRDTDGDVAYQFIDDGKIKKQYIMDFEQSLFSNWRPMRKSNTEYWIKEIDPFWAMRVHSPTILILDRLHSNAGGIRAKGRP